ncbi:hypothetical protein [Onishia niordana]|uniref:hypothetical protein n=1 Tax=Onishia niordana TaxID=2508711 RepID=UPI0010A01738|nr:hypothetical protein [Halomonas niordiana]
MPKDFHHGARVVEINADTRPIRTVATARSSRRRSGPDLKHRHIGQSMAAMVENMSLHVRSNLQSPTLAGFSVVDRHFTTA